MALRILISGATGFVGGHAADACVQRGHTVSTIARAGSDTARLEQHGVGIHRGDITDGDGLRKAVAEGDVVVHCAAKGGDWGPVQEYRAINVEATRHLLEACPPRPTRAFVARRT